MTSDVGRPIVGYGQHGIFCGNCGGNTTSIEYHEPVDGEPAVLVRCWSGCWCLMPRSHPQVEAAIGRHGEYHLA